MVSRGPFGLRGPRGGVSRKRGEFGREKEVNRCPHQNCYLREEKKKRGRKKELLACLMNIDDSTAIILSRRDNFFGQGNEEGKKNR